MEAPVEPSVPSRCGVHTYCLIGEPRLLSEVAPGHGPTGCFLRGPLSLRWKWPRIPTDYLGRRSADSDRIRS